MKMILIKKSAKLIFKEEIENYELAEIEIEFDNEINKLTRLKLSLIKLKRLVLKILH